MTDSETDGQCCLCGLGPVDARIDLPPSAVELMKNAHVVSRGDVDGLLSVGFCAEDWSVVRDLVLEMGMSPLPRCDAALADFDRRVEGASGVVADEPRRLNGDTRSPETRLLAQARETIADAETADDEALVEALVVNWALEDLGVAAD